MPCGRSKALVEAAAVVLVMGAAPRATAYCLTTTCSTEAAAEAPCEEIDGCLMGGTPLHWTRPCISFSVQERGSPRRDIGVSEARQVIGEAYYQWTHAKCGDGERPAIDAFDISPIACGSTEYQSNEGNANVWVFRDKRWPYDDDSGTLALTTVTFNPKTGEILDADVEVNTFENAITMGNGNVEYDLAAIATHEAGHVFGLDHSNHTDATMYAGYDAGSVRTRWLHIDDVLGVCSTIPPEQTTSGVCDPFPATGFSSECHEGDGCMASPRPGRFGGLTFCALLLAAASRRRRSLRSEPPSENERSVGLMS